MIWCFRDVFLARECLLWNSSRYLAQKSAEINNLLLRVHSLPQSSPAQQKGKAIRHTE
jgi:hypothetical protein